MQVDQGTTEWFPIQKGVRQSCILSPGLFNLYSKNIIKTGGAGDMATAIGKATWKINTIPYTDNTARMTWLDWQYEPKTSDRSGLNLNPKKTTVMSNVEQVNIFSDGEDISTVTNYKFLVVLITNGSYTNEETKKWICLSKAAMENLTRIIKNCKFQLTQKLSYCREQSFQQGSMGAQESR